MCVRVLVVYEASSAGSGLQVATVVMSANTLINPGRPLKRSQLDSQSIQIRTLAAATAAAAAGRGRLAQCEEVTMNGGSDVAVMVDNRQETSRADNSAYS